MLTGKLGIPLKINILLQGVTLSKKVIKGAQMYDLARVIVKSPYYLGAGFSWGDERIEACSREEVGWPDPVD
jgi:hypothetical protein